MNSSYMGSLVALAHSLFFPAPGYPRIVQMPVYSEISHIIRKFIASNFLFRDDADEIADADSLLESRVIDSMGVLELVTFLEERFEIRVADNEVVPKNLDSIGSIAAYVGRKLPVPSAQNLVGHAS
jgi:acyl carrier protein